MPNRRCAGENCCCINFFSAEEPEALAARFVGHTPDRAGYTAALDGVETARYFAGLQTDELIDILCEA